MRDKKVMVDNDPTEVFYECDPKKATTCHKTTCYINGGNCHLTTRESWGLKKVDTDTCGHLRKRG